MGIFKILLKCVMYTGLAFVGMMVLVMVLVAVTSDDTKTVEPSKVVSKHDGKSVNTLPNKKVEKKVVKKEISAEARNAMSCPLNRSVVNDYVDAGLVLRTPKARAGSLYYLNEFL